MTVTQSILAICLRTAATAAIQSPSMANCKKNELLGGKDIQPKTSLFPISPTPFLHLRSPDCTHYVWMGIIADLLQENGPETLQTNICVCGPTEGKKQCEILSLSGLGAFPWVDDEEYN